MKKLVVVMLAVVLCASLCVSCITEPDNIEGRYKCEGTGTDIFPYYIYLINGEVEFTNERCIVGSKGTYTYKSGVLTTYWYEGWDGGLPQTHKCQKRPFNKGIIYEGALFKKL